MNARTQGRRQRGGQWFPAPPFETCVPLFHAWPTGCCIHPILHFKNMVLLLAFGPSFWFLAPLLLNPGDGPARNPLNALPLMNKSQLTQNFKLILNHKQEQK